MQIRAYDARQIVTFTIISIVVGAMLGHVEAVADGSNGGYLRGAVIGGAICFVLTTIETQVLAGVSGTLFRQTPFLVHLVLRTVLYITVILLGLAAGSWLLPAGDGAGISIKGREVWYSVALSIGFNLLAGVDQLLGRGMLFKFVAGRYHRPRIEDRILLFIDMESSTQIAEHLGELRFLTLLNRFVSDVTTGITEQHGEIHKYVGDEVIATWKLASGSRDARCIRACFDALDRLAKAAPAYEAEFGTRVCFRAGLHCGPVVIGELGLFKMEIALLGDTMNTAARIQAACRDTGHRVLASAALLDRIDALPDGVVKRSLGPVSLRGKETEIELFSLEARDVTVPEPAYGAAEPPVTSAV